MGERIKKGITSYKTQGLKPHQTFDYKKIKSPNGRLKLTFYSDFPRQEDFQNMYTFEV